jgi:glycine cleavage system H protein
MELPAQLQYTKDHEWILIQGKNATIGITDFAQGELGDIVFVEIGTVGQQVGQGEVFGSVEAVKTVSDLFMPLGGKVLEVNSLLEKNPEKINEDPYGEGWIIKIELSSPMDSAGLLSDARYKELIGA